MASKEIPDKDSRLLGLRETGLVDKLSNFDLCEPLKVPPVLREVVEIRKTLHEMFGDNWMAHIAEQVTQQRDTWGIGQHVASMMNTGVNVLTSTKELEGYYKDLYNVLSSVHPRQGSELEVLKLQTLGQVKPATGRVMHQWIQTLHVGIASPQVMAGWRFIYNQNDSGYKGIFEAVVRQMQLIRA